MFSIIGIVVVFGCVVAGYLMEHGNLKVLMQPAELIIILGAAIGTVLIANPLHILTKIGGGIGVSLWWLAVQQTEVPGTEPAIDFPNEPGWLYLSMKFPGDDGMNGAVLPFTRRKRARWAIWARYLVPRFRA